MDSLAKILQTARAGPRGSDLPTTDAIFERVALSIREHMAEFDASHDFEHVLRVTALAHSIFAAEVNREPLELNLTAILLAALLHDVTDQKYAKGDTDGPALTQVLDSAAVPAALSQKIIAIVHSVSYSAEKRDPERTRQVLLEHPELGVVQDADRLDAIGAIGIGRAFTFGGAKMPMKSMQLSREHMTDKLDKLASMMKTKTGRNLAKERTERIGTFCAWWDEESSFAGRRAGQNLVTAADFDKVIGRCAAITDHAAAAFAPELIAAYPEAKVILNVRRDLDAWHDSVMRALVPLQNSWIFWVRSWFCAELFWLQESFFRGNWRGFYRGSFEENSRRVLEDHCRLVRSLVPPGRLLEWDVGDGWETLCKFLEQPVPSVPFPTLNKELGYEKMFQERVARADANILACVSAVLVGGLALWLVSG